MINKLNKYLGDKNRFNVATALKKWVDYKEFEKLRMRVMNGLRQSTTGKMYDAFRRWKHSTELEKLTGLQKAASLLERKIQSIYQKSHKRRFDSLKESWFET